MQRALLLILSALLAHLAPAAPKAELLAKMADDAELRLKRYASLPGDMSSRALYSAAFALAEANRSPESVEFALATGARMQDRDANSRGYGNLRWDWQDGSVLDYNAVEFCMQYGALLKLRDWDRLTPKAQAILNETLDYAIEGCLRHRVPESYTNIALMNAENLIILGEIMGRKDALDEGKERLNEVCNYTAEYGIHEYDSPTYYGVDLECLLIIREFAKDAEAKQQAETLLNLFWTDLAGNWYPPAHRLAGARSRDYNYLRGTGLLGDYMLMAGWLPQDTPGVKLPLVALLTDWQPSADLKQLCDTAFPRLVQQRYGSGTMDVRTSYLTPRIALSAAGTNYGPMDLPFCIDFASKDRNAVRGYFIPDARRDPYGKKKIPAGGGHEKTLHLRPFWAATQLRTDALGLVVYRGHEFPANPPSLESHFVFPMDLDEIRVGEDIVTLTEGQPFLRELKPGEPVFLRKGKAVAGIRVPWTRSMDDTVAPAALVYDANQHGAARITVGHHSFWGLGTGDAKAGAAFWIRVGDGLDDAAYADWRSAFTKSPCQATVEDSTITIQAAGTDGPLSLAAAEPFSGCLATVPAPHEYVLAINGKDQGRALLASLPGVRERQEKLAKVTVIEVAPDKPTVWEAEAGVNIGGMRVAPDNDAFGNAFVWTPGKPGEKGTKANARLTFDIKIPKAGTYCIWGRVKAATPDDDSFFLSLSSKASEPLRRADWHIGQHDTWEWVPLGLNRDPGPTPVQLTKGDYRLELSCREDGAMIDQFMICTDPAYMPQ